MFSHVMVGTTDVAKAKEFYDAVLGTLDIKPGMNLGTRVFYMAPGGNFAATLPIDGQAPSVANGGTIAFAANSAEQVNAWHAAGLAAGGTTCEDAPGLRENGPMKLYLAYLRDLDGNKLCAMHRPA